MQVETLFAFIGDTHPQVFADNPWLFEYPVIITECTYLDDKEIERAHRVGHTVWSELRPVIAAHAETTFVLIHFSLRHSDRQVVEFFERQLRALDGPQNIVVWAHREGWMPEQRKARSNLWGQGRVSEDLAGLRGQGPAPR